MARCDTRRTCGKMLQGEHVARCDTRKTCGNMCSKNIWQDVLYKENYVIRCGPRTCGKMWHKNVARCSTRRKCGNMWHKNTWQLRPGYPVVSFDNFNQENLRYLNHFNLFFIIHHLTKIAKVVTMGLFSRSTPSYTWR